MSYNYLASPYSHRDSDVMEDRYNLACEALVWLLERKIWTYSPIVHCHELAKRFDLPRHYSFWHQYNKAMLKDAMSLIILSIEGWDTSVGIQEEMKIAHRNHIASKFLHRTNTGIYTLRSTE